MATNEALIEDLLACLKSHKLSPEHIEFAQVRGLWFANVYNYRDSKIISSSVTVGVDADKSMALVKGLMEYIERIAFKDGHKIAHPACTTERSDGFAAFPLNSGAGVDALKRAREIALAEAYERFLWASWWDSLAASEVKTISEFGYSKSSSAGFLLEALDSVNEFDELIVVAPTCKNYNNLELLIVFAKIKGAGFISGGAAGHVSERDATLARALAELLRHALAAKVILDTQIEPQTFYERRLALFCLGSENEKVYLRLATKNAPALSMPELAIDTVVPHKFSNLVVVYRCLFKDQPPFVGGNLDRLCL